MSNTFKIHSNTRSEVRGQAQLQNSYHKAFMALLGHVVEGQLPLKSKDNGAELGCYVQSLNLKQGNKGITF